ncbi:hypothetical protein EVG20_g2893 [Dentipellis fragilis]|uniref:Large ribosomal subunit protein bL12 C-terminal domain-containing protein n=1 Tax=Dentipellis fragilis TaxID=205917 RepID=A0A4Y9Z896_9AGAM|nr:hypothetical protein EVG20_g2893 [Dentipellis fragilis]
MDFSRILLCVVSGPIFHNLCFKELCPTEKGRLWNGNLRAILPSLDDVHLGSHKTDNHQICTSDVTSEVSVKNFPVAAFSGKPTVLIKCFQILREIGLTGAAGLRVGSQKLFNSHDLDLSAPREFHHERIAEMIGNCPGPRVHSTRAISGHVTAKHGPNTDPRRICRIRPTRRAVTGNNHGSQSSSSSSLLSLTDRALIPTEPFRICFPRRDPVKTLLPSGLAKCPAPARDSCARGVLVGPAAPARGVHRPEAEQDGGRHFGAHAPAGRGPGHPAQGAAFATPLSAPHTETNAMRWQTRLNIQEIAMPAASAAAPVAAAAADADAPVEEKPKEKTIFNVKLESFDAGSKPKIIKEVKALVPNLTLIEAKKFVESLPKILKESLPKEDADKIKKTFESLGGVVVLE